MLVIHNFKRNGKNCPGGWRTITSEQTGLLSVGRQGSNNYSQDAKYVQVMLTEYFSSNEGQVPWQYRHVTSTGN